MRDFSTTLAALIACLALAACSTATDTPMSDLRVNPLDPDAGSSTATPMDVRIPAVLQEAKQQYDDGHYEMALRHAQQAQSLIEQHIYDEGDWTMALNIQGYCLLQIGHIEPYFVRQAGAQDGAITKFKKVRERRPQDFRATLGLALCEFRIHSRHINKADTLTSGMVVLEGSREGIRRAVDADPDEAVRLIRDTRSRLNRFIKLREDLLAHGHVFRDVNQVATINEDRLKNAPWLGLIDQGREHLNVQDASYTLDDAVRTGKVSEAVAASFRESLQPVVRSWKAVRDYWRLRGLESLQGSRDQLLALRKQMPEYFWVDRDLMFVYQSLGAFFLDIGLEQARMQAIANGASENRLESDARRIYLSEDFNTWEKAESGRNYKDALEYTQSFVRKHQDFERLRVGRRDAAEFTDENSNPFLVDVVARYRATMSDVIAEERNMRASMALEAAALCIEPLFQINDTARAEIWASHLQTLKMGDPIHHFVRGTAYYNAGMWEDAIECYEAYNKESSITQDHNRRSHARLRIRQAREALIRSAGAGESSD